MSTLENLLGRVPEILSVKTEAATIAASAPIVVDGLGWIATIYLSSTQPSGYWEAAFVVASPDDLGDVGALEARFTSRRDAWSRPGALDTEASSFEDVVGFEPYDADPDFFAPDDETIARREAALDRCIARHAAVAEKFAAVYGLRLPMHVARFAAFLESLSPLERSGLESSGVSGWGITEWYADGALDRATIDGLDPRLDCRFRADPPEFVTVAGGNSDGEHFGLWYDDPAELPSFVVSNFARDSAETHGDDHCMLHALMGRLDDRDDELSVGPDIVALERAVEWFLDLEQTLEPDEREASRWTRAARQPILGGLGPALLPNAGDPRWGYDAYDRRATAYREDASATAAIVAEARQELAAGKPAFALVVGRELHWRDQKETNPIALELLVGAYEALGRRALAEITRVHHANRDLQSVSVFVDVAPRARR
ncbi:MAG: DUF2228 domain-containing protein [Polyangiaceae bacterium]